MAVAAVQRRPPRHLNLHWVAVYSERRQQHRNQRCPCLEVRRPRHSLSRLEVSLARTPLRRLRHRLKPLQPCLARPQPLPNPSRQVDFLVVRLANPSKREGCSDRQHNSSYRKPAACSARRRSSSRHKREDCSARRRNSSQRKQVDYSARRRSSKWRHQAACSEWRHRRPWVGCSARQLRRQQIHLARLGRQAA